MTGPRIRALRLVSSRRGPRGGDPIKIRAFAPPYSLEQGKLHTRLSTDVDNGVRGCAWECDWAPAEVARMKTFIAVIGREPADRVVQSPVSRRAPASPGSFVGSVRARNLPQPGSRPQGVGRAGERLTCRGAIQ